MTDDSEITDDPQSELNFNGEQPDADGEARIETERAQLRSALVANQLDTLVRKVAWVLNYYPDARDSDITLMLHYWEAFDSIDTAYGHNWDELYRLTRLTALARGRARIRTSCRLVEASSSVR